MVLVNIFSFKLIPGPKPQQWQTPWAIAPRFSLSADGNLLTIAHVRVFEYRSETDYTPRYRTETYDLRTITGADFAACHWDGMETVCHTMMSFNFVAQQQEVAENHTAYNTVADNCSTGVIKTFRAVAPDMPWYYDFLPIHNGDIARVLYRHGVLQTRTGETFDAFRKRCYLGYDPAPNTAPG